MSADYVYRVTNAVRQEIIRLLRDWDISDISDTPYGATAGVAQAAREFISYLIYGRNENLRAGREFLARSIHAEASASDQLSRWVAAHLLNLADDLRGSSLWTVLPPEVPPGVRRAFSMSAPKVLALWPPSEFSFLART